MRSPEKAAPLLLAHATHADKWTRARIVDLLVFMKQADAVAQMRGDKDLKVRQHVAAGRVFLGTNDAADLAVFVEIIETDGKHPYAYVRWVWSANWLLHSRKKQALPVVEARIAKLKRLTEKSVPESLERLEKLAAFLRRSE